MKIRNNWLITAGLMLVLGVAFVGMGFSGQAAGNLATATTGAIEGHVIFKGPAPKPEKLKVTRDHQACGTSHVSEEFVVSKNGGLKNVVFRLELMGAAATTVKSAASEITLEQKGCTYIPHVQTATAGSKLNIVNDDPVFHNVHAMLVKSEVSKETIFNIPQIPGSDLVRQTQTLSAPGIYEFVCDIHSWMKSYVIVHSNNFITGTDADGYYSLANIPPGVHKLKIWHEALGESERTIVVSAGKTLKIDLPIEANE